MLRIVCRNGFSHDLADLLLADLRAALDDLEAGDGIASGATAFHH